MQGRLNDRIMAGQNNLYEVCRRPYIPGSTGLVVDRIGFMILSCHDSVAPLSVPLLDERFFRALMLP